LQRIPSAGDEAQSPHSTERTGVNALCGLQACKGFSSATRLVVSHLGNVFDNLLIFNDLNKMFSDIIYITNDMPISAIEIAGFQVV